MFDGGRPTRRLFHLSGTVTLTGQGRASRQLLPWSVDPGGPAMTTIDAASRPSVDRTDNLDERLPARRARRAAMHRSRRTGGAGSPTAADCRRAGTLGRAAVTTTVTTG